MHDFSVLLSIDNKSFRHLSFRNWSDLNTLLLRPGLVELTCHVHMRTESGHLLLQVFSFMKFYG